MRSYGNMAGLSGANMYFTRRSKSAMPSLAMLKFVISTKTPVSGIQTFDSSCGSAMPALVASSCVQSLNEQRNLVPLQPLDRLIPVPQYL